jgi:hypothetical protein
MEGGGVGSAVAPFSDLREKNIRSEADEMISLRG